jgi:integrating conjugative element protein (TIGR03757 family)
MIWKVSKYSFSVHFVWLVSLVLFADVTFAGQRGLNSLRVIEVFTSSRYPIVETKANDAGSQLQGPEITVYEIDGIQSIERDLSLSLPVKPQQSKQIALQRIQNLDERTRLSMQLAAQGLAKVMQYGIDRFPAIVFDGQVVVYGVTDLQVALAHYESWRTEHKP